MTAIARSASSSLLCCITRLNTSNSDRVGTSSDRVASIGFAKSPALGPSAKYSSQPDESTTFIRDRYLWAHWCQYPLASPVQPWSVAQVPVRFGPDTRWHGVFLRA